jgi:hydroxymethylpyrimidine pyrophosphatase-like HAD family hydrolase
LKETGRRLDLVTGRELRRLEDANLDFFDRVAAENGAVVYEPRAKRSHVIGDRPPRLLWSARSRRKDRTAVIGENIIATWSPDETTVLEAIHDLGLEIRSFSTRVQSRCFRRASTRRLA